METFSNMVLINMLLTWKVWTQKLPSLWVWKLYLQWDVGWQEILVEFVKYIYTQKKLDQHKNKGQILCIVFGIDALSVYFIIHLIPQRMLGNVVLSYKYITSKCG